MVRHFPGLAIYRAAIWSVIFKVLQLTGLAFSVAPPQPLQVALITKNPIYLHKTLKKISSVVSNRVNDFYRVNISVSTYVRTYVSK